MEFWVLIPALPPLLCDLGQVTQPSWPQLPLCHGLWTQKSLRFLNSLCSHEVISPWPSGAGTQESERQPLTGWGPWNLPCVACDLISGPSFPGRVWGRMGGLGGHVPAGLWKLSLHDGITLSFPQHPLSHLTPQRVQRCGEGQRLLSGRQCVHEKERLCAQPAHMSDAYHASSQE